MGLEMIDKKLIYDKTFGKVIPETEEYNPDESSESASGQLGYNSTNMLKMVTFVIVSLFLFVIIGIIFFMIYTFFYKRCTKTFKKVYDSVKGKIFYNTVLRTTIQQFVDLGISTLLALKAFFDSPGFSLNICITFLLVVYLFVYPLLTKRIVKKHCDKLGDPKVRTSVGTLYINQDITKVSSCLEYHMWFMYRRLVFAATIALLDFKQAFV